MTRLNQVVALEVGVKADAAKAVEQARHKAVLKEQMAGISRTYHSRTEDGDTFPPESTRVQITVASLLDELRPYLTRLFDLTATKERTNQNASADVVVDGSTVIADVPVTVLLFLERQLDDLAKTVAGLPVLDPSETWLEDDEPGVYRTPPRLKAKTNKVPKAFVRYEATKEHPAQVDAYTEDVVIGDWETVLFSGAINAREKQGILDRIRKLKAAVLVAREEANSLGVIDVKIGADVLDFVLG